MIRNYKFDRDHGDEMPNKIKADTIITRIQLSKANVKVNFNNALLS